MWDRKENRFRYKNAARISPEGNLYCNDYAGGPENDRFVPQECTGLRDKFNNEIHEGDFLEVVRPGGKWNKSLHLVVFDEKLACFSTEFWAEYYTEPRLDTQPLHHLLNTNYISIVGNTFQNPELSLKPQDQENV